MPTIDPDAFEHHRQQAEILRRDAMQRGPGLLREALMHWISAAYRQLVAPRATDLDGCR